MQPGFDDPVFDSQGVFRSVMFATAYPGRIQTLESPSTAPTPLSRAAAALCLTLADIDTPLWLDEATASSEVIAYLHFHCGARILREPGVAVRFAVLSDLGAMPPLSFFHPGDDAYPDRSTTLVVEVQSLTEGPKRRWTGPGIRGTLEIGIAGMPESFWSDWDLNRELYPRGVDVVFTCDRSVLGLPRTIKVES
ncbi:phosphonate C-P lyase system protein PhnH [Mesorhizobium onobrychidis]|uniref:Phosphonate C-P lyase system protein PhnH n=1 Tax=Mesorhizobium onobrychidis TaxID=2775404 RepID=A0ABY5R996_9HYPH|nr:phosphonate C-P lyase system protein PhnH [Mesorhizobium onobrychidis]